MSTNLVYYPAPKPKKRSLAKGLKYIISQRAWGHDGMLAGEAIEIGYEWADFLNGVHAATSDGSIRESVVELLSAISTHGSVYIELE